jgi:hypothetical protein
MGQGSGQSGGGTEKLGNCSSVLPALVSTRLDGVRTGREADERALRHHGMPQRSGGIHDTVLVGYKYSPLQQLEGAMPALGD